MSWQDEARELLRIIEPKGRGEIETELRPLFEIYNNNRVEITGELHTEREIAPHCSGCVPRVISRLKAYLNANPK